MSFATRLTLQSGDRAALDGVVDDIRETVERKGAEMKGPHSPPPTDCRVPLQKSIAGDGTFGDWQYTVYSRRIELVGHDALAREIADWDYPDSVHLEVEVENVRGQGSR
jgi:small subunit ribosomal protein S10